MLLPTISVSILLISLRVYFRRGRSLRRALVIGVGLHAVVAALIWGGPLSSGALFLLLPAPPQTRPPDLPYSYRALHRGHVDLETGLYIREDDDFIVSSSPHFVWRRAYLSRDRVVRQLGIGTTHNADRYLYGDPANLTQVAVIMEDGSRVRFDRTSRGTSVMNAMFQHTDSATEFYGARLGWTGRNWALRFWDGGLAMFRACDTSGRPCVLASIRDARGNVIQFKRDAGGVLRTIEAGPDRLHFEYDDKTRIVRASQGPYEARYEYDDRGRLVRSTVSGVVRSFAYGTRDEMIRIEEPGQSVENTYDDALRVIGQVVRRRGRVSTYSFVYKVHEKVIVETEVVSPNGSRTTYRWGDQRRQDLEIHEGAYESPILVQYARPDGVLTRSLTISCTKDGRPVSETVEVWPGDEARAKAEVIERICSGA
jgi:YD repeat-containing protein